MSDLDSDYPAIDGASLRAIVAEVQALDAPADDEFERGWEAFVDSLLAAVALWRSDPEERCRVKGLVNEASGVVLPTTDEIIGSMPDLTGGLGAVEYLRQMRGEDEPDDLVMFADEASRRLIDELFRRLRAGEAVGVRRGEKGFEMRRLTTEESGEVFWMEDEEAGGTVEGYSAARIFAVDEGLWSGYDTRGMGIGRDHPTAEAAMEAAAPTWKAVE